MEGFRENERRGLLGKIIIYFDTGTSSLEPASEWGYSSSQQKQILLEYFTNSRTKRNIQ